MTISSNLISFSILFSTLFSLANAVNFYILNQCPYTVWAAALPGGGQQLKPNEKWTLMVNPGTASARIWGRTNCNFDGSGRGRCETGDCNGLLHCQSDGQAPHTLAEFSINQFGIDIYDLSLLHGFNLPMDFGQTTSGCKSLSCRGDIKGQCPNELRTGGGCNNPCDVFKTNDYCCKDGPCGPTHYSQFFSERCHDSITYPLGDVTNTFTCPSGKNYRVVFCPKDRASFSSLLEL